MMKTLTVSLLSLILVINLQAQTDQTSSVERACLDYIEGFYEGDTTKLIRSISPTLYKFGFRIDKESGEYGAKRHMNFDQAKAYANWVQEKKRIRWR